MFDIGFSEILVIAVVALIVLGPERLPRVARTMGHLFGRAQRYVNQVKSDISREMELDELRQMQQDVQRQVQEAARSFEQNVQDGVNQAEAGLKSLEDDFAADAAPAPAPAPAAEPAARPGAEAAPAAPAASDKPA